MVIDEPMRENGIRVLHFDDFLKCAVMFIVDNCVSVDLIRIGRVAFKISQAFFASAIRTGAEISCQAPSFIIEEHHFVAQGGESRDGAAAAVFGITGMSAGDDDFVLPCR